MSIHAVAMALIRMVVVRVGGRRVSIVQDRTTRCFVPAWIARSSSHDANSTRCTLRSNQDGAHQLPVVDEAFQDALDDGGVRENRGVGPWRQPAETLVIDHVALERGREQTIRSRRACVGLARVSLVSTR